MNNYNAHSHIDMEIGDESQDSVTDDATDMESTPTVNGMSVSATPHSTQSRIRFSQQNATDLVLRSLISCLELIKIHGKGLKEENFQGILEKWRKNSQEVEIQNLNLFKLDYFNSWFYIRDLRTYSLLCGVTDTDIDTFCSLRKSQIMKCDNPV